MNTFFLLLFGKTLGPSFFFEPDDLSLMKAINIERNTALDPFFSLITHSVEIAIYTVPIVFIALAIFKKRPKLIFQAKFVITTVIFSAILTTTLKQLIGRPRPYITYSFIQKIGEGGSPSFPSGHTSDAFVLATIVSLLFPKWKIIIPSFVWATLVGYSRIFLGVHYPSDVVFGAVLGVFSGFFVRFLFKKFGVKSITEL